MNNGFVVNFVNKSFVVNSVNKSFVPNIPYIPDEKKMLLDEDYLLDEFEKEIIINYLYKKKQLINELIKLLNK